MTAESVTVTALVPRADAVKYVLTENDFLIVNGVVGPTQVCVCVRERERDREEKKCGVWMVVWVLLRVCVCVCVSVCNVYMCKHTYMDGVVIPLGSVCVCVCVCVCV